MIAHVVLFRPRRDLDSAETNLLIAAISAALEEIPSIRRSRVGRRVVLGKEYERLMLVDYEWAAILEFDDRAGLTAYLDHGAHERLAASFFQSFEAALIYDFEMSEGAAGLHALCGDR